MNTTPIISALTLCCAASDAGTEAAVDRVRLETSLGNITLALDAGAAPKTVENFLRYVQEGHYDGTIFHRVISGFMIQGGGMNEAMQGKPSHQPIANEADNGLKNQRGTVAMARTMEPHSASAQFFINSANNDFLDHTGKTVEGWGYCVFGEVVEGMDVVDTIEGQPTTSKSGHQDVPKTPIIIQRAVVE